MNYIRKRKKWSIFWCTVLPGKISLKSLNNVVVDKEIVMHVDRNAILRVRIDLFKTDSIKSTEINQTKTITICLDLNKFSIILSIFIH